MNQLVTLPSPSLPALIAVAGERAQFRFMKFFASNIRNPHTRRAYVRAVAEFGLMRGGRHGLDYGRAAVACGRVDRRKNTAIILADRQAAAGRDPASVRGWSLARSCR